MKKIAGFIFVAVIMGFVSNKGIGCCNAIQVTSNQCNQYQTYFEPALPNKGSLQELYQDIIMTMLWQPINKAADDFYEKNTGYSPKVDPWEPKVLSVERPDGYRTFTFIIKIQVEPYLGAHNSIGEDQITLSISPSVSPYEVKVLEYKHIKDYPIPPWLRHE